LKAQVGDLVSWNNQTSGPQTVVVLKPGSNAPSFTTNVIEKFKSSSPGYVVQKGDIDPPEEDIDDDDIPADAIRTVTYENTAQPKATGTIKVVKS
jgi:hypothetical protein